ncbi:MAG: GNAT family N-acetyltransferase [Lachnospiraceae bacterium]|nr:GNAT family N-acetyltransferase [Lachnospiraceae bacterium]
MTQTIKKIEDLSLNAWPSHQMQLYDGWILRFSYFYTHRTNCVEQIGTSSLPVSDKIDYCESVYRRWQTPCIFKISPVGEPGMDALLAGRGYHTEHHTTVMTRTLLEQDLRWRPEKRGDGLIFNLENQVSYRWIDGLFSLKHTDNIIHRRIVPEMYRAIPKDVIAVSVIDRERVIATGLGILDRDDVGIYAIHVDPAYRRIGLAADICRTLFREAALHGATHAYLQVVTENPPARALYKSLGFSEHFTYWFRVKDV